MSHPILHKYRTLRPVNDEAKVNLLLEIMVQTSPSVREGMYAHSAEAGRFYLFRHDSAPGKVLEYVPDYENDTSVTTLCEEHPIFESRQALLDAREEIIRAIDQLLMAVPNTATVLDSGRGRQFRLPELGTAQLIDVLQHFSTH